MITTSEILGSFGRQWNKLVKLGPIFTEQVDRWAEKLTRRAEKRPEEFSVDFDRSVSAFLIRNCRRPSEKAIFRRSQSAVPFSVLKRKRRALTSVGSIKIKEDTSDAPESIYCTGYRHIEAVNRSNHWDEDLVEERTRHLRPRAASVVRRLVAGEKIDDIAQDHGSFSAIGLLLHVYQADKKAGVR